jgi:hypothetical protein
LIGPTDAEGDSDMFRSVLILFAAVALAVSVAACRGETHRGGDDAASGETSQVAVAAAITRAVASDPDSAEAVLREHGLTVEEFEAMMYDIAADPELSADFEAATE